MKKNIFFILTLLFTNSFCAAAFADEDAFGNILNIGFVTIESVDICNPEPEESCEVKAKLTIQRNEEFENMRVATATLFYSVNGGPEYPIQMIASDIEERLWHADIPGQESNSNVSFYIRIDDTLGNTTTGAIASSSHFVMGVPDIDNSQGIVSDDTDILNVGANYDDEYIYVKYNVQGEITGGTVNPPYFNFYIVKFTNPDIDYGEGLMTGKAWFFVPIIIEKGLRPAFLDKRLRTSLSKLKYNIETIFETGMVVMDISEMWSGEWEEGTGFLFEAEPEGRANGGKFIGRIRRSALGENPSGYMRIIVMTAASTDENLEHLDNTFPLNCSHFLTLYTSSYNYTIP